MSVLQIGMERSGNYWLYNILQNIIKYSHSDNNSLIQNHPIHSYAKSWELSYPNQADIDVLDIEPLNNYFRISSIFRMPIENIEDYIKECSHVWSYSRN